MAKNFTLSEPAVKMTMVGFGQAGTRIVDKFAEIKKTNGTAVYNCLALNSNDGDLSGLKYIPKENQVSLKLGGLGKDPTKAIKILEENDEVQNTLKSFITERVRPDDELVLFFAGLGGGTGTSTIVKAIEEFSAHYNRPIISEEWAKIVRENDKAAIKANPTKYQRKALENAIDRQDFIKIGVVVTLPVRADGPEVLRQVNEFTRQIWELANNKTKGIAFVVFADNQHFYDEFNSLQEKDKKGIANSRDYANQRIFEIIHELNTAPTVGNSSVVLDSADFKRILLKNTGCLVINRVDKPIEQIQNSHEIRKMFKESLEGSSFHQPISLARQDENGNFVASKIHNFGMLAVLDQQKDFGDSFIDDAKVDISDNLPINGIVYNGYIVSKNDYNASVYTFFKTDALPARLAKGLVEEYKEYQEKNSKFTYQKSAIAGIETEEDDEGFDFDLDGLMELPEEPEKEAETEEMDDELDFLDPSKMNF
ncbi:MAG: cell division protein FtsZ [Bacillaceae bacterium]